MKTYNREEVYKATLSYFDQDDLATNVFIDKYCLKDREGNFLELTPDDMHHRLAKEFARIEKKFGGKNQLSEEEIYNWLKDFKYIVPQGSVMYGLGNDYSFNSLSNCTVIDSPEDNISSIINTGRDMANLFKMRCGVGVDISNLRPDGASVNNSARTSTGAWSFVKLYSEFVNTIGQKGRRGAGMVSIRGDHPDVVKFISSKKNLAAATGVNISIKIFDKFMEAVVVGEDYLLTWEDDKNKYEEKVDARELWDVLVKAATDTAEPGILYWDRHIDYNPSSSYEELKPITTNPCLVGDTEVYVADGRGNVKIKALAEEGKDVPVFCFNGNDKVVIKYMRNPRVTGYREPIYKITLDDGSEFKTTKNHKFKLKGGEYREVKDLNPGDSLKIITKFKASIKDIFGEKARSQDYWWLNNGFKSNRAEHVYIAEFYSGKKIIPGGGEVVHHKDYDASNNSPDNLEVYKKKEHDKIHADNMRGDNNPMRRAATEWSEEKWATYKSNMSAAMSGPKNGRAYKATSEDIWDHAVKLTLEMGRKFSTKDWNRYAKGHGLPCHFNKGGWRERESGTVVELAKRAATFCGFSGVDLDPRVLDTIKSVEDSGLRCEIEGKEVAVVKNCEFCASIFKVPLYKRETCFCSRNCYAKNISKNNSDRALEKTDEQRKKEAEKVNESQVEIYLDLKSTMNRKVFKRDWENKCKRAGVPYTNLGRTPYSFSSWTDLKEEASMYNHKVVSVEICGHEDVYNGTVDEHHNFFVACAPTKTKNGKEKVCYINNLQCGEVPLSSHDMCRLISCNLKNVVDGRFTKDASIDLDLLKKMYRFATRLGDDLVELELEKIEGIMDKAKVEGDMDSFSLWEKFYAKGKAGRRIGTGCHGLADMLSSLCVRYDSDEGVDTVEKVFNVIRDSVYEESINLAKERGKFELFDWEKEKSNEFIKSLPKKIRSRLAKNGRRNVCLITCAPTGSVSICSRSSSGIEPIFRKFYTRRRKINKSPLEEHKGAFMAEDGQMFEEFSVAHPLVFDWQAENPDKDLPDYFIESDKIDWSYRIKVQSVIQKCVDNSISATVNLPRGTDYKVVGDLYMQAWEQGLKGITVYVEGSREGILVSEDAGLFEPMNAPKREEVLKCRVHHTQVNGAQWVVFVGLLDNKPYEIFAGLSKYIELPKKYTEGFIVKRSYKTKNSEYDLVIDTGDEDKLVVKNIVEAFENADHGVLGRLISLSLRHHTPPAYLSEQLLKDTDFNFTTYSKCMGRVLKKYIVDGEVPESGRGCPECGGELSYVESCVQCMSCGWGKCS